MPVFRLIKFGHEIVLVDDTFACHLLEGKDFCAPSVSDSNGISFVTVSVYYILTLYDEFHRKR